ncbi:MAG: hypothetical protein ACYCTV_04125 [Leptospirales bacterium]
MWYRWLSGFFLFLLLATGVSCTHQDKKEASSKNVPGEAGVQGRKGNKTGEHKTILVLLDKTASVKDQNTVFSEALDRILSGLRSGDRFRLALITGASDADFDFVAELNLKNVTPFNPLVTNEAVYRDAVDKENLKRKQSISDLKAKVKAILLSKPTAQSTDLFGAIYTSSLFFDKDPNQKVLVILSDMIEEDPNWRFNHLHWNVHVRKTILNHEKKLGLIPNLGNICVYVVGAKAPNLDMLQNIRFFWSEYFEEAHAGFSLDRYAHTMLHWPPSPDCGDFHQIAGIR